MASKEEFTLRASPWEWRDYAEELRAAAVELFESHPDERIATRDPFRGNVVRRPLSNAAALLAGLALENLIKAILVTEDPTLVAEGSVKRLKSHTLTALTERSKVIRLDPMEQHLCAVLSDAIPVWGRYPVPLQAQHISNPQVFDESEFHGFLKLYARLFTELEKILGNDWPGPHGMHISSGTVQPR